MSKRQGDTYESFTGNRISSALSQNQFEKKIPSRLVSLSYLILTLDWVIMIFEV